MDERDSVGVSIRSISKQYGSTEALKDITLNIEPGEFVSLLGPSGSGKTTLLGALGGFVMPSSGSVWVGDQDMTYMPPHKRNIGIVFQSYALFPHMSVGENVAFPLRARRLPKSTWPERVKQALAMVELDGYQDRGVSQLSGGQRQRVALARAIVFEPRLILMDEPLGALDALTREKMQSLVLKLWKETGKTIILITHSVEEALLLGERLVVMAPRPGRIHKEYRLPFADLGVGADLREVKKHPEFGPRREEILNMIWNMEEEIMGRSEESV